MDARKRDPFRSLRNPPPFRGFPSPLAWAEDFKRRVSDDLNNGADPARDVPLVFTENGVHVMTLGDIHATSAADLADAALMLETQNKGKP